MRAITFLSLLILPLPAQAFIAQNGMDARRIGPTEIAVQFESWARETDYWRAAGDFAERRLNLSGKTRLWRATPRPREAGLGIVFTLDPAKKADGAGLSQFGKGPRDGSLSVGAAVGNHCRRVWPFWLD